MTIITEEVIDYVNEHINNMSHEEVQDTWNVFVKEQPALVGYILGESQELEEGDAKEDTAYILTVILLSFKEINPHIATVTETEFESAFHHEFDEMEAVFHDGFDETDAMNMVNSFCQPDMLGFVAAIIYSAEDDENESNFSEEEAGLFTIIFKTIIQLLHNKMTSLRIAG